MCTVSCSIHRFDDCTCIALHAGSFDLKMKSRMVVSAFYYLGIPSMRDGGGKEKNNTFPYAFH